MLNSIRNQIVNSSLLLFTCSQEIELLLDKNKPSIELMSLAGLKHESGFGAGGTTVVVLGYVSGVLCLINANVATRKAGAIDYATSLKNLRLSQIASENKLLTINLVESGGANLPDQDRVFNNYGKFNKFRIYIYLSLIHI